MFGLGAVCVGLGMSQQDVMRSVGCCDVTAFRMCPGLDRKLGEKEAAMTPAGHKVCVCAHRVRLEVDISF